MEQVRSTPQVATPTKKPMRDSRWPSSAGWLKMHNTVNDIVIHHLYNLRTGAVRDFKFKDKG